MLKFTEILAIYAALLSTVVFAWNILRATPRIKIRLVPGVDKYKGEHVSGAYMSVQNPSAHAVHITHVSVLYPYRERNFKEFITHFFKHRRIPWTLGWVHTSLSYYDFEDNCPATIEPGKAHNIFIPQVILEKILKDSVKREIMVSVQDQLWRHKYSRKLEISVIKENT